MVVCHHCPRRLLTAINGPSSKGNGSDRPKFDSSIVGEGIPKGQRDDQLFRYASQIRANNAPVDIPEKLILEAAARCKPPFPEREAIEKVQGAYSRYEPGHKDNDQSKPDDSADKAKHKFTLLSAKDILATDDPETQWLLDGILPAGGMSLLVAKPKVGKTTLALNLAIAVARGTDFLGRKVAQGPVVYLALEEKKGPVKKKLAAGGITDEPLKFHFGSAPQEAFRQVEALIVETGAKLLIIDVLQKFCRVRDLNDYAQVTNALEPLMSAARKHVIFC